MRERICGGGERKEFRQMSDRKNWNLFAFNGMSTLIGSFNMDISILLVIINNRRVIRNSTLT